MRSEVPSRWRHSFIVPVPKKPPFSNPSNYRPISITSVFARLFEKIVKGKVTTYLNQTVLFPQISTVSLRYAGLNRSFAIVHTKCELGIAFLRSIRSLVAFLRDGVCSLFIAYTACLPTSLSGFGVKCLMYADDIKLYKVIESASDCEDLQRAIDHIVCWSENWGLPLAPDKTKVLRIGNERFSRSYKIGSVTLESVQEIKDLGFIFSNKLGFETHYKSL
ncbi:hypothetical protein COOONC_02029, partial [Cooperia oncophora]